MTGFTAEDHRFMAAALGQAELGLASTSPNPRVGCVIVREGRIVGQGWHERAGEAHAEVHALQAAGALAHGATVYVTLEPCAHHGRTPPCTEALIKAGVGSDLIEGIRQVARGKSFVRVSARAVKEEPQLSGREREVLILVARGHTNRAIAERLGVKPKTVETYRARLQDKLGVSGRAEIFAYAEREGLLDPARRELSSTQS